MISAASIIIFPALVIFFYFKKLRVLRVALHRNLLVAVSARNILTIMTKSIIILQFLESTSNTEDTVMENNSFGCRFLAFLESVSKNAIYSCMFIDAFYLHKLIVRMFVPDPNELILYGITAGNVTFKKINN